MKSKVCDHSKIILVSLFSLLASFPAFSQWELNTDFTNAVIEHYLLINDTENVMISDLNEVWKTYDGGQNYLSLGNLNSDCNYISFIEWFQDEGVGFYIWNDEELYKSDDKAESWQLIQNEPNITLNGVTVYDESSYISFGYDENQYSRFYYFNDIDTVPTELFALSPQYGIVKKVKFFNDSTALILSNYLLFTEDAGQTLDTIALDSIQVIYPKEISFNNDKNGFLKISSQIMDSCFFVTTDGGKHWTKRESDFYNSNFSISAFDTISVLIEADGSLFLSHDMGLSFEMYPSNISDGLSKYFNGTFWFKGPGAAFSLTNDLINYDCRGFGLGRMFLNEIQVFSDSFIAASSFPGRNIVISNDKGISFEQLRVNINNEYPRSAIRSFEFIDKDIIYVLTENNVIYKSTDGGQQWIQKYCINSPIYYEYEMVFSDSDHGYVFYSSDDGYHILRTTNEGENWSDCWSNSTYTFYKMQVNGPSIYLVGQHYSTAILFYSHDYGNSWNSKNLPIGPQSAYYFVSEDLGFAWSDYGFLYRTQDGGDNWTVNSSLPTTIRSMYFKNQSPGFFVGFDGLYQSVDSGLSWQLTFPYLNNTIYQPKILFANESDGYVFCRNEVNMNLAALLKTTNGGLLWTDYSVLRQESPDIYPNPCVDELRIDLKDLVMDHCLLRILDLQGRVLKEVALGNSKEVISVSDIQSGIYIVLLISGKYNFSKQLIKL